MNKTKVGIVTHYYKNQNYGGMLQAYALCKVLENLGYDAKQICYDTGSMAGKKGLQIIRSLHSSLFSFKRYFPHLIIRHKAEKRVKNTRFFRDSIPHTDRVYSALNIDQCDDFDVYVTGSDQVWNPDWYNKAYLLDFVKDGKAKISYAASLGANELSGEAKERFRASLATYSAISVREENAVKLLNGLTDKIINLVLDPTLLLSSDDWSEICEGECPDGDYVFCYFLGGDVASRKLAESYAKKKGYKLISIPYMNCVFRKADKQFDCTEIYDLTPGRFVKLIRNAKCVFTDSFHASVFSHIFKKEYFAFVCGEGAVNMSGRLYNLANIFNTSERICGRPERMSAEYLLSLSPIDYSKTPTKFNELREFSFNFLKESIEASM